MAPGRARRSDAAVARTAPRVAAAARCARLASAAAPAHRVVGAVVDRRRARSGESSLAGVRDRRRDRRHPAREPVPSRCERCERVGRRRSAGDDRGAIRVRDARTAAVDARQHEPRRRARGRHRVAGVAAAARRALHRAAARRAVPWRRAHRQALARPREFIRVAHRRPATRRRYSRAAEAARLLAAAFLWQFAGYLLGSAEIYLALSLIGHPAGIGAAIAIEALTQAVRQAVFIAPAGLGVQEVTVVAVAGAFGIGREAALSLALVRRMREIIWGGIAVVAWRWSKRPARAEAWASALRSSGTHRQDDETLGRTSLRASRVCACSLETTPSLATSWNP